MSDKPIETIRAVSPRRSWRESMSEFLSLEYVFALVSVILAVLFACAAVTAAFGLWNDIPVVITWPLGGIISSDSGYVSAITMAVGTVIFACLAYIFFARVTLAISRRQDFTTRAVYRTATYGALGLLALQFALFFVTLVAILIGSLVLIGGQTSIKALYLREFLPTLINAVIVGVAGYYVYAIAKGRKRSGTLTLFLITLSAVLFIAIVVTVAVRAHDTYSPLNGNQYQNSSLNGGTSTPDMPFSLY